MCGWFYVVFDHQCYFWLFEIMTDGSVFGDFNLNCIDAVFKDIDIDNVGCQLYYLWFNQNINGRWEKTIKCHRIFYTTKNSSPHQWRKMVSLSGLIAICFNWTWCVCLIVERTYVVILNAFALDEEWSYCLRSCYFDEMWT